MTSKQDHKRIKKDEKRAAKMERKRIKQDEKRVNQYINSLCQYNCKVLLPPNIDLGMRIRIILRKETGLYPLVDHFIIKDVEPIKGKPEIMVYNNGYTIERRLEGLKTEEYHFMTKKDLLENIL